MPVEESPQNYGGLLNILGRFSHEQTKFLHDTLDARMLTTAEMYTPGIVCVDAVLPETSSEATGDEGSLIVLELRYVPGAIEEPNSPKWGTSIGVSIPA